MLLDVAVFAGGCFWCMEETFENAEKVGAVVGDEWIRRRDRTRIRNISSVQRRGTGHKEVVRVLYDKNKISYKELLFLYFRQIDPTREDGMFLDGGEQYTSAITSTATSKKKLWRRSIGWKI